jgi:hypothetical protein
MRVSACGPQLDVAPNGAGPLLFGAVAINIKLVRSGIHNRFGKLAHQRQQGLSRGLF